MEILLDFNAEMWTATNKSGEILKTATSYDEICAWADRKKHTIISTTGLDDED